MTVMSTRDLTVKEEDQIQHDASHKWQGDFVPPALETALFLCVEVAVASRHRSMITTTSNKQPSSPSLKSEIFIAQRFSPPSRSFGTG